MSPNHSYADAILLARCGIDPTQRTERERSAFAQTLKAKTAQLAAWRDTRRAPRARKAVTKGQPEPTFGAQLCNAIDRRLGRRRR